MFNNQSVYIIAEVANAAQGVVEANHQIIDAAVGAGSDGIKFQFYKYDELATPYYEKYENFKRTFYTEKQRLGFIEYAYQKELDIYVDIFDRWGLDVACKGLDKIKAIKVPPSVILDDELVRLIMDIGKTTLIGVGGYSDEDIDFVISKFDDFKKDIILIHGFQGFPTNEKDSSLSRIRYLKNKYNCSVGYADHVDAESDLALRLPEYAYFAGADIIEKHITLDRSSKGLDYYSSLLPDEFSSMVGNLRRCAKIMGSGLMSPSEKDYLKHSNRVTTTKRVKAGELLFRRDINFRRTDNKDAIFPTHWPGYKPAVSIRDIDADRGVSKEDIKQGTIGTVVGCRMHSTRLPQKALLKINGVSSIERCLINTLASKHSKKTILATSTHPDDEILKEYTLDGRIHFMRGAETDIVARFIEAAEIFDIDIIIRVTGDRPIISPELMDFLVEEHLKVGADFSCFKNISIGINPEVINTYALKKLKTLISTDNYSEYLTLFLKNNPGYFRINEVEPPAEFRHMEYRLVLDYPEDLEFFRKIFERLDIGREPLRIKQVLDLLKRKPEIAKINSHIKPKYTDSDFAAFLKQITTIEKHCIYS